MRMSTWQNFLAFDNPTFSHPFVNHSQNWSACPTTIEFPSVSNAIALSPDESLLAVAVGRNVLIYQTEGEMTLSHTLKGLEVVSHVEWYAEDGRKLVSGSRFHPCQKEGLRF
jgi:hypothetical protein